MVRMSGHGMHRIRTRIHLGIGRHYWLLILIVRTIDGLTTVKGAHILMLQLRQIDGSIHGRMTSGGVVVTARLTHHQVFDLHQTMMHRQQNGALLLTQKRVHLSLVLFVVLVELQQHLHTVDVAARGRRCGHGVIERGANLLMLLLLLVTLGELVEVVVELVIADGLICLHFGEEGVEHLLVAGQLARKQQPTERRRSTTGGRRRLFLLLVQLVFGIGRRAADDGVR